MAEEFHAGICGETWWNPAKYMFAGCNSPMYSTGIADIGSLGWSTDMVDIKARSNESVFFHKPQLQADSTLEIMGFGFSSSSTSDWDQCLPRSNGRTECYNSILPEHIGSRLSSGEDSSINGYRGLPDGFSIGSDSYDCSSTLIHTLFEADPEVPQPQSLFNNQSINYMSSTATYGAPSISPPPLTKQQQEPAGNLHLSNNTSFWNPSATSTDANPSFLPSPPPFEEKPNAPSLTTKTNIDGVRKNSGTMMKKGSSSSSSSTETPLKRPRLETPSPLPTFKVRKEKLGDRITALQQLVSPFGKTDTASVLHEAIEYIKFLHDQVINADHFKDKGWPKQDLRSRGLCLVPLSSTFPLANETPVDFWTPTFGSGHRT